MQALRRIIGRLLFPKVTGFNDQLQAAFFSTLKEIANFKPPIRELSVGWLAVAPYVYFRDLFLEQVGANQAFVSLFARSPMINAEQVYTTTQAYFLRHLMQLISANANFKKHSKEQIVLNICQHMRFGREIIDEAQGFTRDIENMACAEDFAMCYVEKVLAIQYPNADALELALRPLAFNSYAMLFLATFTAELIKRTMIDPTRVTP